MNGQSEEKRHMYIKSSKKNSMSIKFSERNIQRNDNNSTRKKSTRKWKKKSRMKILFDLKNVVYFCTSRKNEKSQKKYFFHSVFLLFLCFCLFSAFTGNVFKKGLPFTPKKSGRCCCRHQRFKNATTELNRTRRNDDRVSWKNFSFFGSFSLLYYRNRKCSLNGNCAECWNTHKVKAQDLLCI